MRLDVKKSLQSVIQGVSGVKAVYTHLPRQQSQFPAVVITTGKSHEKAVSLGNPGRRHITYTITLYIQSIDTDPNEQDSQDRFDNLLDAVDVALRANKNLSGTVLKSAVDHIDTDTIEPSVAGQGGGLVLRAIKTFDVLVEIIA